MSEHIQAVVAHYDGRAATYDDDPLHRGLVEVVADLPEFVGRATALDVACGTGLLLRALARRRDDLATIGVDRSAGMLEVAARQLPGARLLRADATALPIADSSVDIVTGITVLHLLEDPGAVVAEWARVLAPSGLAITATFDPTDDQVSPTRRDGFARRHDAYRSPDLVASALEPHGFRLAQHAWWNHDGYRLLVCVLRARSA